MLVEAVPPTKVIGMNSLILEIINQLRQWGLPREISQVL